MADRIQAGEVPGLLRHGMRVFVSGGASEPIELIRALQDQPSCSAGVRYVQSVLPGLNGTDFSLLSETTRMETFMLAGPLQKGYRDDRIDYIPIRLRALADYLSRGPIFDLALVQVMPTDDPAQFSCGLNADLLESVLTNCKLVIAEINRGLPCPPGAARIPANRIDRSVEVNYIPPAYPLVQPTSEAEAIGGYVADLVHDGDCIQTGIGSIPYAVLSALRNKNDLGLHSGIVDDGVRLLADSGVINGSRKAVDRHRMVVCMAIGSQQLYQWVTTREDLDIRSVTYTHSHEVMASLDNFVSINSAIEIDFLGQVNAEMVGGRQIAGVGGSIDFMWGAAASRNGRSIIALNATAAGGKASRIVASLTAPNATTAPRTEIDTVVTEYGVAELKYLPVRQRGDCLSEIAAPQFRDELRQQWRELRRLL